MPGLNTSNAFAVPMIELLLNVATAVLVAVAVVVCVTAVGTQLCPVDVPPELFRDI